MPSGDLLELLHPSICARGLFSYVVRQELTHVLAGGVHMLLGGAYWHDFALTSRCSCCFSAAAELKLHSCYIVGMQACRATCCATSRRIVLIFPAFLHFN